MIQNIKCWKVLIVGGDIQLTEKKMNIYYFIIVHVPLMCNPTSLKL